jgi:hypothetical protein
LLLPAQKTDVETVGKPERKVEGNTPHLAAIPEKLPFHGPRTVIRSEGNGFHESGSDKEAHHPPTVRTAEEGRVCRVVMGEEGFHGQRNDADRILPAEAVVYVAVGLGIHRAAAPGGGHVLGPLAVDVELVLVLAGLQANGDGPGAIGLALHRPLAPVVE